MTVQFGERMQDRPEPAKLRAFFEAFALILMLLIAGSALAFGYLAMG